MFEQIRSWLIIGLSIALCLFTLKEVNFPRLQNQSMLAIFVMFGLVLCFLVYPLHRRFQDVVALRVADILLALGAVICCGFVVLQSEPAFEALWLKGRSFGDRASFEHPLDFAVSIAGVLLVLEATRRAIGWIVPLLALGFVVHSFYCYQVLQYGWPAMPDWMLPHSGQSLEDVAVTAYRGVFGVAASVMFKYVFLFIIFGAFLEISGATSFIVAFAQRVFGRSAGGPAKVAVVGSGLMGSLSGSAVANAVTTGTFTIPMMRQAGFQAHTAGGITAAAASGGALVPPVMGAGAYMMLELVVPQVSFLQIARAAIVPAILYYFSLWMIVHYYSRRMGASAAENKQPAQQLRWYDGIVFFTALAVLIGLLLLRFTAFRAVTGSLVAILLLTTFRSQLEGGARLTMAGRMFALAGFIAGAVILPFWWMKIQQDIAGVQNWRQALQLGLDISFCGMFGMIAVGLLHPLWRPSVTRALVQSARNGISLVAASACVGIIIAIVHESGIADDFSRQIEQVVEQNLLVALLGIMGCSIILGMGVPSVVCYLLMATLMGALLQELGVIPLAAHLFIFYFGMMSMVTPPVALAAYASASIAQATIMRTAFAAFRFALVGFTLPYMFVYRPALLLMNGTKWNAWMSADRSGQADAGRLLAEASDALPAVGDLALAVVAAVLGIMALAAGIAGFLRQRLRAGVRIACFAAAGMLLLPEIIVAGRDIGVAVNVAGAMLFAVVFVQNRAKPKIEPAA